MARKVVKVVEEDDLDLRGILANLSPDGSWIVKIFRREGGSDNWLADLSPADITEQVIAEKWGSGRYIVRPWNDAERVWGRSKVVNISADAAGVKTPAALSPSSHHSDNVQLEMVKLQMQLQQKSSDQMLAMFQQFNTSMMGLVTALITRPNDTAAIISAAKELNGGGGDIGKLRDMISLSKELSPGGGGDDLATAFITGVLPKLLDRGSPPAAVAAATPVHPSSNTSGKENPMPAAERAPQGEIDGRMRLLNELKDAARRGKDPEFWAEYIEENDDRPECEWILTAVHTYQWPMIEQGLMGVDPEIGTEPYKTWFEKLYQALITPPEDEKAEQQP